MFSFTSEWAYAWIGILTADSLVGCAVTLNRLSIVRTDLIVLYINIWSSQISSPIFLGLHCMYTQSFLHFSCILERRISIWSCLLSLTIYYLAPPVSVRDDIFVLWLCAVGGLRWFFCEVRVLWGLKLSSSARGVGSGGLGFQLG